MTDSILQMIELTLNMLEFIGLPMPSPALDATDSAPDDESSPVSFVSTHKQYPATLASQGWF